MQTILLRFFVVLSLFMPVSRDAAATRLRPRTLADLTLWGGKHAHVSIGGIGALEIPELKRKMRDIMGWQEYSRFQRFLKKSLVSEVYWYGDWMSFWYCEAHNCGHNFVVFVQPEDASVIVCETLMPEAGGSEARWLGLKARVMRPAKRCELNGYHDDQEIWNKVIDELIPKEVR